MAETFNESAFKADPATYIRAFRARHGLTQKALAEMLHCSKRAVEQWEASAMQPQHYLVFALMHLDKNHKKPA